MDVTERLKAETEKWAEKFDARVDRLTADGAEGSTIMENARAYRADTAHFIGEQDWVRAFEAIVWAWSWLEIGEELHRVTAK